MRIQPLTATFTSIGNQAFLRSDVKYRYFWDVTRGEVVPNIGSISLREILSLVLKTILKKGDLQDDYFLLSIDLSESRDGQLRNLPSVNRIGSDKLLLKDADMIITKLGATRGYVFDNTLKGKNLIGSTELIPYKMIGDSYLPAFLKYLLLLPVYLNAFSYLESGKTPSHWRVAPLDLLRIKIPKVPLATQCEVLSKIRAYQEKINKLNDSQTDATTLIDRVFADEFGYAPSVYQEKAKDHIYQKEFVALSRSFILRSSVKFQHPKYDYTDEILCRYPTVKLKTLCSQRIHRGVQPEYDSNGDILVVKTVNLKHGYLDFSESAHVTQQFFESNSEASVQKEDILISSTGEGRGKVDIYELEEPAIADSHISIVRLKNNINPYYVLYFMHSLLGKLQLETLEMAIKGTPEIYAHQLEQMRIIDLPPKRQHSIVEEIRKQLLELQKQRTQVQRLRDQIDEIFMQTIVN